VNGGWIGDPVDNGNDGWLKDPVGDAKRAFRDGMEHQAREARALASTEPFDENWLNESDLRQKPKKNLLEKDIEAAGCRHAEKRGWRAMKFTSPSYRSVPDRIHFKHPGRVFFIEYKKPGEVPTEKQAKEIKRLRDEGFDVFVVDDIEQAKFIIDMMG
jgi:hypothetical protein